MTVKIGNITFDHISYDAEGDVLYLHVGKPQAAADAEETPEGHAVRFSRDGQVIGLTLINARWLLDRDGAITITLPQLRAEASDLAAALRIAG